MYCPGVLNVADVVALSVGFAVSVRALKVTVPGPRYLLHVSVMLRRGRYSDWPGWLPESASVLTTQLSSVTAFGNTVFSAVFVPAGPTAIGPAASSFNPGGIRLRPSLLSASMLYSSPRFAGTDAVWPRTVSVQVTFLFAASFGSFATNTPRWRRG